MSAESLELYSSAYRNVRDGKHGKIVNGLNQFKELQKIANREPISLTEINYNLALALYRLHDKNKFDSVIADSKDPRIIQLAEIFEGQHEGDEQKIAKERSKKHLVQQISFILISASILTFVSHL